MKKLFFLVVILCSILPYYSKAQVNVQDSLTLVDIYNSTGGPNWTNNTNWLTTNPVSTWHGITVSGGRVTIINLRSNNLIDTLPDLSSLVNLETLYCYNNQLSSISNLSNLVNLKTLFCFNNQIISLPDLSDLVSLEDLDCNFNLLTTLPDVSNLVSLIELKCRGNQLENLPELDGLINLVELNCSNNQIKNLPNLNFLENLGGLHCSYNQLDSLPQLPNSISGLYCNNNKIKKLPDLSQKTSLSYLNCSFNELTFIPEITSIYSLSSLICNDNNLSTLPDLSKFKNINFFLCENNILSFDELENIANNPPNIQFYYIPQNYDTIPILGNGRTYIDSTLTITVDKVAGTYTQYEWFKDGACVKPVSQDTFITIPQIDVNDGGMYTCNVTNSIVPGITQYSYNFEVAVYGIDSLGGVYYPNEYVIEFVPSATPTTRQALRDEFQATVLDSCMCGQQLELWEIPDTILLDIGGDIQYVHDDNTKKGKAKNKASVDGVDFNYIIRPDNWQNRKNKFQEKSLGKNKFQKNTIQSNTTSSKLKIAVLDTGLDVFDTNSPLYPYRWTNPDESGGDSDNNCYDADQYGIYIEDRQGIPNDDNSHGSHIGQLITTGLSSDAVELIPVKTHDDEGWGSLFNSTCGIYYAKEKGADIINTSWSYFGEASTVLFNAIQRSGLHDDILFISSAGNHGRLVEDTLYYPVSYYLDNIIGVMSIDNNDQIPDFSNYGSEHIDLAAKGVDIENDYGIKSGTSMSTAYTTKFAAMIKLRNPDISYRVLRDSIFDQLQYPPSLVGMCSTDGKLPEYMYLPLELLSFEARLNRSEQIQLNWSTASEINITGFEVQGSSNGYDFSKIGFVKAQNLSHNEYEYIDKDGRFSNTVYYRLKILEGDGTSWYSDILKIDNRVRLPLVSIIENPVNNQLTLEFTKDMKNRSIHIYNAIGKLVKVEHINIAKNQTLRIDISDLPSGTYLGNILYQEYQEGFKFQKL